MPRSFNTNGNSSLEIAHSNQELIVSKGKRKKRACIIVSTLLAIIAVALIIATIVLLKAWKKESLGELRKEKSIALQDIYDGRLLPKDFNATWVKGVSQKRSITFQDYIDQKFDPKPNKTIWTAGNNLLFKDEVGDLRKYNVETNSSTLVLSIKHPILQRGIDYELSPDGKFLIVAHDYIKLYRHSYNGRYTIIDLQTEKTIKIGYGGKDILFYAAWAPVGNAVVFVMENNIYYMSNPYSEPRPLTDDGNQAILNGSPDWVYEEEVFSSNKAIWFSIDGKKLAYAKFNDTYIESMFIPVYGPVEYITYLYPKVLQIRYPKPGTKNPVVSLLVVDLVSFETTNLPPPNVYKQEAILAAVSWATDSMLSAIWMNRVQNEAILTTYDTENIQSTVVHTFKQPAGWVELFKAPLFSKDGSQALIIWSHDQRNDSGGFSHITSVDIKNKELEAITSGLYVVSDILAWDEKNNIIYYEANTEDDLVIQHVYSINTKTKETKCLSCNITNTLQGTECLHNSAKFNEDATYYILNCAGPGSPEISIYSSHNNTKIATWENNMELVEMLKDKALPIIKRFTVPIEGGFEAHVSMRLPPNIKTDGDVQYPMLVNVYGGPDSNQVSEKFNFDWGSYLTANKSIIYVSIDGRGSGMKGDKMRFAGYRRLGTVEIFDQINVTKHIQKMFPYVDATRTGIWGWSYGGYASGMVLVNDKENVFNCGISVAPVTDWRLYDSIYTERFMGLPDVADNLDGYEKANLITKYKGLIDKKYYLIHGTLDDNVHYQQSMLWSEVLEHNDIIFRQQSYADQDHTLAAVRPHLYHSLENFLDEECFAMKE